MRDDKRPPGEGAGAPPSSKQLERVQTRLRQLEKALATMQVGVTITDRDRKILYVNPAEAAMHGYEPEDLIGRDATLFAPESLRRQPMKPDQLEKVKSWRRESVNARKDGTTFPVEILSDLVTDTEGNAVGLVSIAQDITERKRAEAALRESEERYALALRGANDGLWDWNLLSGEIYFSDRWKEMLGLEGEEVPGSPEQWWNRVHLEDLDGLKRDLARHLEGSTEHLESEHRMLHADGDYRWMLARGIAVRGEGGQATRIAGSQTDITDRKVHDPLTGLPNRALFLDRLGSALRRKRRRMGIMIAVLFLDLDRFKVVNDSLGHLTGDQLLIRVAAVLESCLRPGDSVARLGGDEFTILLEDIRHVDDALRVAERIHQELERPLPVADQEVFTTVSIGIALAPTGLESPEELLRDADTAMYRAKSAGAGRHQLFDQDMRRKAVELLRTETDLRHALDRGELLLFFQPILSLRTDRVTGFEALLRWQHPERGLVAPHEFIALAEDTGLIIPIGGWALREACSQLSRWHRQFPGCRELKMSVNLSPKQFNHPDLLRQVTLALEAARLPADSLQLEITESAFIDNMTAAINMVARVREMGVEVSIDDFGTGYSSLSYLHSFPVDSLKIDQSFIGQVDRKGKQAELVRSIIDMASNLGVQVIAEGVETDEQEKSLRKLSCGYIQGYAFSKPVPPDEVERRFLGAAEPPDR